MTSGLPLGAAEYCVNDHHRTKTSLYHHHNVLTTLSKKESARKLRYVEIFSLHVGHSLLHLLMLSFMHILQNRWPQSGCCNVSSQSSKHMGHSNSS